MTEHTPTPWIFDGFNALQIFDGDLNLICYVVGGQGYRTNEDTAKYNAAFIVRACNAHYALVDALEEAVRHLAAPEGSTHEEPWPESPLGRARAAIKLARGKV